MAIQLSVIVWTIINFSLLMLILHHLLFKPVLRLMDQRKERIQSAAQKKATYEQQVNDHRAAQLEQREADRRLRQQQLRDDLEAIRVQSKHAVEAAQDERLARVDRYRAEAEAEQQRISQALGGYASELASVFAESVIKG